MLKPLFKILDSHYNTNPKSVHKCTMKFVNTSAIRMCEALFATNPVFLQAFKHSTKDKCPHGYLKDPQDLAAILSLPHILGVRSYSWASQNNGNPPVEALGKQGIICHMGIPDYKYTSHIDLWDNNSAVGNEFWEAKTTWLWTLL